MKHVFTILIILILGSAPVLQAQSAQASLSPQVIASMGGFFSNEAGSLSWTMGETVIATHTSAANDLYLTHGFQQPTYFLDVSAEKIKLPDFRVKVYPNPATDFIRVEWETETQKEVIVELYDLIGRRVSQKKSDDSANHIQINMQSLQRSAYLLKVYTKDRKYSRTYRVVKY